MNRKFSAKREEILDLLQSTKVHPGARWVYEQLKSQTLGRVPGGIPGLSLATVYRNLNIFCQEEKILSLGTVNGEERFDGIPQPHPHFICSCCGAIFDLPLNNVKSLLKGNLYKEKSFLIDFRKTVFYGLCKECCEYSPEPKNGKDPDAA